MKSREIPLSKFNALAMSLKLAFVPATLLAVFVPLVLGMGVLEQPPEIQASTLVATLAVVAWLLVGLTWPWVGPKLVRWEWTERQLVQTVGYFFRRKEFLDLHRVHDVQVRWPFPLSLFNRGHVTIYSTDHTHPVVVIGPVAAPDKLAEEVQRRAEASRQRQGVREVQVT
jgi:hypothetical protein